MQTDGNLVIYDPAGHALWASGTWHDPGSRVVVQDDGNVVITAQTALLPGRPTRFSLSFPQVPWRRATACSQVRC
jgi:hypothetical protein